jgi:hypothetical protein
MQRKMINSTPMSRKAYLYITHKWTTHMINSKAMSQIINLHGKNELSSCHLKTIEPNNQFITVYIYKLKQYLAPVKISKQFLFMS